MSDKNSFSKNIGFSFIVKLLTYLIPLVLSPYITRVLGANGVGDYTFALSIANYFAIIVSFGFESFGSKKIAVFRENKEEYSKWFWNLIFSKIILFIIAFSIYYFLVFKDAFSNEMGRNLFLIAGLSIISQLININFLYIGIERMKLFSIVFLITNIIYLVCVFVFVKDVNDVELFLFLKISQIVVNFIVLWLFVPFFVSKISFEFKKIILCFKEAFPYIVPALAPTLASSIDLTMLGNLSSKAEVAYYQEGLRIITLICGLFYAISPIGLSRLSYLYQKGEYEEINSKLRDLFKIVSFIMLPACVGICMIAKYFVPAYFGEEFYPSIIIIYILSPMLITSAINSLLINCHYYPRNKTIYVTIVYIISIILNICLNAIFIPIFGAKGAALTTLIADVFELLFLVFFSWKHINYFVFLKDSVRCLLSTIFMLLVLFMFSFVIDNFFSLNLILDVVLIVVIGGFVYTVSCLILKEPSMYKYINKFLNKKGD